MVCQIVKFTLTKFALFSSNYCSARSGRAGKILITLWFERSFSPCLTAFRTVENKAEVVGKFGLLLFLVFPKI